MSMLTAFSRRPSLFLLLLSAVLVALWIPNIRYPIVSDPAMYAHLSRSMWEHGTYQVLGVPHKVFPPFLPLVSYPLIWFAGLNLGMKLASLIGGILLLFSVYLFIRRESPEDRVLATGVSILLVLSYTVTWLLSVGNADTLYGAEFFLLLTLYLQAKDRPRLYILIGLLLGATMLTRYMGAALGLIVFVHVLFTRRSHLKTISFWAQWPLAFLVFGVWLLRNKLTFGTWVLWHLQAQIDDVTVAFSPVYLVTRNILFYLQPLHSIALFVPLFLLGLFFSWRKHSLVALSIPISILPAVAYHTASTRYLVATIPLLLIFTVEGIRAARRFLPAIILYPYIALALIGQLGMTCLYTLPQCNAWADRTFAFMPKDIGLSQEALESMQEAASWINAHAEQGATVTSSNIFAEDIEIWQESGRLRSDLLISLTASCTTRTYDMNQHSRILAPGTTVYESPNKPVVSVMRIEPQDCGMKK